MNNIMRRIWTVYKDGGIRSVPLLISKRYKRRRRLWTRLGSAGFFLAKRLPTSRPPVLILSLPRSGSSWVGATMGRAQNAMYLREPLTQGLNHYGLFETTVFDVNPNDPPRVYAKCAAKAFAGFPAFPDRIAVFRDQWSLRDRSHRRLVIKEVNPLASKWLLQSYTPRALFLIRHPAAVAASYRRQGWRPLLTDDDWTRHGAYQGRAHRFALDSLEGYDDYRIIHYEALCADPLPEFSTLFAFAELGWNETTQAFIAETTSSEDRRGNSRVARDSAAMIDAWREQVTQQQLQSLREGYRIHDLPWYVGDRHWLL